MSSIASVMRSLTLEEGAAAVVPARPSRGRPFE